MNAFITKLKTWWDGHGTKILGVVTIVVGAAGESLALIQAFDPKRAALWAMVITLAGGIIRRGFTNSATIAKQ